MRTYKEKVERLNLELGPQSVEALRQLQEAMEASSRTDTIRLALQTMAKLVAEARKGGRITIRRKDGEEITILLPHASS